LETETGFADDCLHRQYFAILQWLTEAVLFFVFEQKACHGLTCKPIANLIFLSCSRNHIPIAER
jgi:hypothetical protein